MKKNQVIICGNKLFLGRTVCGVFLIDTYKDCSVFSIYDLIYIKKINKFVVKESTLDSKIQDKLRYHYHFVGKDGKYDEELEKTVKKYLDYGLLNILMLEKWFNIRIYTLDELYEFLFVEKHSGVKVDKEEKKELDEKCRLITEGIKKLSEKRARRRLEELIT